MYFLAKAGSKAMCWFLESKKRKKYQVESTNVSMVSVSRFAGPPHLSKDVSIHRIKEKKIMKTRNVSNLSKCSTEEDQ